MRHVVTECRCIRKTELPSRTRCSEARSGRTSRISQNESMQFVAYEMAGARALVSTSSMAFDPEKAADPKRGLARRSDRLNPCHRIQAVVVGREAYPTTAGLRNLVSRKLLLVALNRAPIGAQIDILLVQEGRVGRGSPSDRRPRRPPKIADGIAGAK